MVLKAQTAKGAPSAAAMQQAISVLESRVNGTGNSGAQVQQQGADLINVTVPGKAAQDVINLVSSTAKLAFRPVLLEEPYTAPAAATPGTTPSAKPSGAASPSATPSGTAKSAATGAPAPSAGASTSASPKASTQDFAAKLASPSATPTGTAPAKASATPSASTTPDGKRERRRRPRRAVGYRHLRRRVQGGRGHHEAVQQAGVQAGRQPTTVDDSWKKTVGYTDAGDQWDDLTSQIVSCDPSGTKYVLGPAVFEGTQLTDVTPGLQQNSTQWVVNLTLNSEATKAFGTLTTNQYNNYFSGRVRRQPGRRGARLDGDRARRQRAVRAGDPGRAHLRSVHDQRPAAERLHRGRRRPSSPTSSSTGSCR